MDLSEPVSKITIQSKQASEDSDPEDDFDAGKSRAAPPDGATYTPYSHPMPILGPLKAPVYKLRYLTVELLLEEFGENNGPFSMVEFGCADLKFFSHISQNSKFIAEQVFLVDIKQNKLQECKHKAIPTLTNYFSQKEIPLNVKIYAGSIAYPFEELKNIDAVVAIEVIEHLYPNIYEAMEYNIFGFIQPKIVILTTPNSDFNVLFPNFKGKRDPDHKFEWSREQFYDWGTNITHRFPEYQVEFQGIGSGVVETAQYGTVSQLALFRKIGVSKSSPEKPYGICKYQALLLDKENYKLIEEINFPFVKREVFILGKLGDIIRNSLNEDCPYYEECFERLTMPVDKLLESFNNKHVYRGETLFIDENEARNLLEKAFYKFEDVIIGSSSVLCLVYSTLRSDSSKETSDNENNRIDSDSCNNNEFCYKEEEEW